MYDRVLPKQKAERERGDRAATQGIRRAFNSAAPTGHVNAFFAPRLRFLKTAVTERALQGLGPNEHLEEQARQLLTEARAAGDERVATEITNFMTQFKIRGN